jgi:hypothetical protein
MPFHAAPFPEQAVQGGARNARQFADTGSSQARRAHFGAQDFVDSFQSQIVGNAWAVLVLQDGLENAPEHIFEDQMILVCGFGQGTGERNQDVSKKGRPNAAEQAWRSVIGKVGQ